MSEFYIFSITDEFSIVLLGNYMGPYPVMCWQYNGEQKQGLCPFGISVLKRQTIIHSSGNCKYTIVSAVRATVGAGGLICGWEVKIQCSWGPNVCLRTSRVNRCEQVEEVVIESVPGSRTSMCKGPEAGGSLTCCRNGKQLWKGGRLMGDNDRMERRGENIL